MTAYAQEQRDTLGRIGVCVGSRGSMSRNASIYLNDEECDYLDRLDIKVSALFHKMFKYYLRASNDDIYDRIRELDLQKRQIDLEIEDLKTKIDTTSDGLNKDQRSYILQLVEQDHQHRDDLGSWRSEGALEGFLTAPFRLAMMKEVGLDLATVRSRILEYRDLEHY